MTHATDDSAAWNIPGGRSRLLSSLLLLALFVAIGWECFDAVAQRERSRIEWRERLGGVATKEQHLIQDWLAQQGELARLAARQPWAREIVDRRGSAEEMRVAIGRARQELPLWQIAVFDSLGRLMVDEPQGSAVGAPIERLLAQQSLLAGQPRAAVVPVGGEGRMRLSIAVPITVSEGVVGAHLVLSEDSSLALASMLSRSDTSVVSKESLLVERVGSQLRILTPLRFPPVAVADETGAVDGLPLVAGVAADGNETFGRFLDYRRQVVLAATRPIAGTSWGLLVKVDEREALAAWRHEVAGRGLRSLLILGVVGALAWNARQAERLRAVLETSRRDARYRLLIGRAQDAVLIARATDGRIVEANRAAERLYGCSAAELCTLGLLDLRSMDSSSNIQGRLLDATADERYESRHRRRDGSEVFVEVSGGRLTGGDEPLILAIVRDVSRRKIAEARLRESQERLSLAIASTGIGLWELNVLTGQVEYSREWMALLGYDETAELGNTLEAMEALVLPEDLARAHAASAPYLEHPSGLLRNEVRMRHRDGTVRWILACGSAVETTPEGRAARLIGYNIDITDRKRAEEELQNAFERFHMVSRATHDIVWDWDLPNETVWWSSGLETLLGHDSPLTSTDRTTSVRWWHENIHAEDRQRVVASKELAIRNAEPLWTAQYRFRNAAGAYLEMDDRGYFVSNGEGRAVRAVGAMVDVTARRQAEQEVLRVNAELEQRVLERTDLLANANRELESFAYSVSHDLRAPLRAISGFACILDEQHAAGLDDEGRRLLGVVRRSAARMGALIDDLLTLSRASRQELRRNAVDMEALLRSVWAELAGGGEGEEIELVVTSLPSVQGDLSLLRQVWASLLANAIKFSAPREHRRIEVEGLADAGGVTYAVRDNGVGFDMAYADKLFGLFQRLHGRDEFEGTGVGLALVQRIVQRHGGRLWCESAVDKGASFYFWLPRA